MTLAAPNAPAARRPSSSLLLVLFLASGASGLVYEIVWIRLLALTLSVTVYAMTTVLCAFMAGLALGAAIAGRVADRLERPLLAYGVMEIGVGLAALVTAAVLFRLGPAYVWLHDRLGDVAPVFMLARFLLAFAVLLVPCTLMGTTLPLLGRALIDRNDAVARGAGGLYAVNTLGAVLGCLVAGFVLVPRHGLRTASGLAAALCLLVGAVAVVVGRGTRLAPGSAAVGTTAAVASGRAWPVYAALAASGFTALGYEVLWTRALEIFVHNSTYAYSAMLATFLFGIALGSAIATRVADRLRRPLLALAVVEIAIAVSVLAALLAYSRFGTVVPAAAAALGGLGSWSRVVTLIFAEAGVVLLGTTLLFGATFPLAIRSVVDSLGAVGARLGAIYAANTVGSIAGALVVGFGLLPLLGMRGAFVALVWTNLAIGVMLALAAGPRGSGRVATAAAAAVAAAVALLVPPGLFERSFVERFGPLLFYREEVTDTVMVTENARGRMIRFGDGRGTAGTVSVVEDRMYGQIPMMLHPRPLRVLSICFGVGNSLSSVLTHPVEHVDAVELSPGVVEAAPFFRDTNRDVLGDPRVRLTIADGRNFLLASHESYDVIRLDPPELHTAGVVNLYTREFYQLARDHLRPGGIFSIWVNVVMTPEEDLRLLVRTVASVFPHVSIWHGPGAYSWIINGSVEPHGPDLAVILAAFRQPSVAADMASIGVEDAFAFLRFFVRGGGEVAEFAGTGPLVVDDHTRLDFSVPRSLDSFFGFANANTDTWLSQLMVPGAKHDVGLAIFFRKVARMATFKRPVLPHLTNVEAAGLDPETLRVRLAPSTAPDQGGGQAESPPPGTRPAQAS